MKNDTHDPKQKARRQTFQAKIKLSCAAKS